MSKYLFNSNNKLTNKLYKNKSIWISWEQHRRTETLSKKLDIQLFTLKSSFSSLARWLSLSIKTFFIILKNRPKVLFVQNPSALLTIESIILKYIFGYRLIVDAHNAGVYPFEDKQKIFAKIFPFMHRYADLTIVTNSVLQKIILNNGGKSLILPDAMPEIDNCTTEDAGFDIKANKFKITFICSFSHDEPYIEVFKASQYISSDYDIYVTGNFNKLNDSDRGNYIKSINFTGYLSDNKYIDLLKSSNVIIDLTTFDDCLVCGAYEAVSCGIPLILSNTQVLREWFYKGVIFTENDATSIASAIMQAHEKETELKQDVLNLRDELSVRWLIYFEKLQDFLNEIG